MYINLMLNNTKFNDIDKIKIGSFMSPLFSSMAIKAFNYEETIDRYCLTIETNKITYFFYKTNKSVDVVNLYAYDYSKKLYIEYYYYSTFLPINVYSMIEGDLSGKGYGEKTRIKKNIFNTIYIEPEIKLDVSYNYKGKSLNSITFYLQHYKLTSRNESTQLSLINYFFTIDIKSKRIKLPHGYKELPYSSILDDHIDNNQKKNPENKSVYSEEIGEMLLSSINLKSYFSDFYSSTSVDETRSFISIVKMFLI